MCGRIRTSLGWDGVEEIAHTQRSVDREAYKPSYNASPGSSTPVVVRTDGEGVVVHVMKWGLVPSFTKKDVSRPDFFRMFNARSEGVADSPAFRRLLPTRRCLVIVDGFYEWHKPAGKAGKQPYYIHLAGDEPLVLAGLWDKWEGPEGPLHTYTILTADSSKRLQWLHDRMPVVLRDEAAQQLWLHTGDHFASLGQVLQLCGPYAGEDLIWHPVTPKMGSSTFQGPECCQEIKLPSIQSFFKPRPQASPAPAAAAAAATAAESPGPGAAMAAAVKREDDAASMAEEGPGPAVAAAATAVKHEDAAAAGDGGGWSPQREQQQQQQQQTQLQEVKRKAAGSGGSGSTAKKPKKAPLPRGQQGIAKFFAGGGSGGGGGGGGD